MKTLTQPTLGRSLVTLLLIITAFSPVYAGQVRDVRLPKKELSRLDKAIAHAEEYAALRLARLDSLRDLMRESNDLRQKWEYAHQLGDDWMTFNADSALQYSRMAMHIAWRTDDPKLEMLSRMQRIRALTSLGLMMWAAPDFKSIDPSTLPEDLKYEYWRTGRHFSMTARAFARNVSPYDREMDSLYRAYDDSLVSMMHNNAPYAQFLRGEKMAETGQYLEARELLLKLLGKTSENDNLYGMIAYRVAAIYSMQGDETNYAYYLTLAAISDVRGAVREGWALPELASLLYELDDLDDAYRYINFAFRDAEQSNTRLRTLEMSKAMPLIDEAYRRHLTSSRDDLLLFVMLMSLLLLLAIVLALVLWRQIKRGRVNAVKLKRTAQLQESYIGNFVGLCSSYAERLDALSKLVARKLSSGQADDLLKMVKSGRLDEGGQDEEFYKVIDGAILDLYPDFVEDINSLLVAEERVELREKGVLTSELRIYAMVRLGVEESTRIARILRYSVSTVYAYRNRMRNRAVNRETFDSDVMALGRIEDVI